MVGTLFWLPAYRPEVLSPSSSLAFVFLISFGLPNGLKKKKKNSPGSSAGKESTCSAGEPGSIPGWGRSPREALDYPLQYSWASR